ncbi:hypothetical protein EVAR_49674_1 [Eumeta japonica]|uniref:Uncharacterized protein n=1 Tax=Eumeta variegata TaxID=151549 RepID=A0A4C1WTM6_EUMVA|nr:hypothetical protein EVAR_49674_1 [Eumeta japonica]
MELTENIVKLTMIGKVNRVFVTDRFSHWTSTAGLRSSRFPRLTVPVYVQPTVAGPRCDVQFVVGSLNLSSSSVVGSKSDVA